VPCHRPAGVERQPLLELLPGKSPARPPRALRDHRVANLFVVQKGRREIFDYIYDDVPDKDWQNPAISQLVEQRYVAMAYERWAGSDDSWVLGGDWMVSRPDILSWMRTIYWKHNKPRRLRLREGPLFLL
jgi:hypothetical protein